MTNFERAFLKEAEDGVEWGFISPTRVTIQYRERSYPFVLKNGEVVEEVNHGGLNDTFRRILRDVAERALTDSAWRNESLAKYPPRLQAAE